MSELKRLISADSLYEQAGSSVMIMKLNASDQKEVDFLYQKYSEALFKATSLPFVIEEGYTSKGGYISDIVFAAVKARFETIEKGDTCAFIVNKMEIVESHENYQQEKYTTTERGVSFNIVKFA